MGREAFERAAVHLRLCSCKPLLHTPQLSSGQGGRGARYSLRYSDTNTHTGRVMCSDGDAAVSMGKPENMVSFFVFEKPTQLFLPADISSHLQSTLVLYGSKTAI